MGVVATGYQVADRASYLVGNPQRVDLDIFYSDNLTFPAVTICNYNNLRYTKFHSLRGTCTYIRPLPGYHITLYYFELSYINCITLRYITLRYTTTLCYVILRCVSVALRYVTLCYVMLRYVTLCFVSRK